MSNGSFPSRQADQVAWFDNFGAVAVLHVEQCGLNDGQLDAYNDQLAALTVAYNRANTAVTRSTPNIIIKDRLLAGMISTARAYAKIAQASPLMTDDLRSQLGLSIRKGRAPRPAPAVSPTVSVEAGPGRTMLVTVCDPADPRRSRPRTADGATILTHVGPTPPATVEGWAFQINATSKLTTVRVDASLPPGTPVWVTAFFYSTRGRGGPAATPVCGYVGGAGVGGPAAAKVEDRDEQAYPKAA